MQARLSPQVCCLCSESDIRDVLARHKRLVHTKPEDREPPKKRGRPPKSSYTAETNQQRKESPIAVNPPSQTASTEPQWPPVRNDAGQSNSSNFEFPKLEGEPHHGSFLTNPFNDNFGFGPLDTLSEFNFAEQDILSFLNPAQSRNIRDPVTYDGTLANGTSKPVVLQPDFVDWLQMNRDDYSFSMHHSSPRGLEGTSASSAPDLIEPNDQKEVLVNPANPSTSVSIDEQTYAEILKALETTYKVCRLVVKLTIGECGAGVRVTYSAGTGKIYLLVFRLLPSSFSNHPCPDFQSI